jgi:hydroxyacylglutathione hydrolase
VIHIQSFTFSPIQENTYVLYNDQKQCAILDPGCYFAQEREELAGFIEKQGLTPVLLLNTHGHLDHIFGDKFVAEKYGLQPHIHPTEKPVFEYAGVSSLMYNMPFDIYTGEFTYLQEGDTVKLGNDELKVLFTPGHSPGSISFYSGADGFVMGGDVLFQRSIGRTDLPGGDFDTLIASIREKLLVLPDGVRVFSGHGPATTIGEERRLNPFLNGSYAK